MKYLHETAPGIYWLDHRLVPEVRGMLAAMSSRAPVGGVTARYLQIVEAVAWPMFQEQYRDLLAHAGVTTLDEALESSFVVATDDAGDILLSDHTLHCFTLCASKAEDRLCEYPLHPKVQRFFDDFVSKYGHSSILELVGGQAIFTENISWLTAWLLFDSPLCTGQEFSTRAVQHKDWPMARECAAHPDLAALHNDWFEVFEAEVAWWKNHLSDEANRKALGIGDKEPFRPALDRARWALPGTISTGCAHTSHLRDRARVIRDGSLMAQMASTPNHTLEVVWKDIAKAYQEALPGLQGMGLREAVYDSSSQIPGHLRTMFSSVGDGFDANVQVVHTGGLKHLQPYPRTAIKTYADPAANTMAQVNVTFRCSLAVARDWHRHRTLYPWHLQVVREQHWTAFPGPIQIDPHYAPKSDFAIDRVPALLARSTALFDSFMADRNLMQAALALPLGTRVKLSGCGGLRDVLYMLELRKHAHGANFEYQHQATIALAQLQTQCRDSRDLDAYGVHPNGSGSESA